MNASEVRDKIRLAEECKRDSRSNEAKWYWQGVVDGLYATLGQPLTIPTEGDR